MEFSVENGLFNPSHSLAAEKQRPGLKSSCENENFKPRTRLSSENGSFMRCVGECFFSFFFSVRARTTIHCKMITDRFKLFQN